MALDTKLVYSDDDFDFGFNAVDENELEAVQNAQHRADSEAAMAESLEVVNQTAQEKLDYVYNMTTSLLRKLAENPEKEYIYWPGREQAIEQAINRLNEVVI